ncbi:mechanosensitive ion channel family protein [Pilimelia columellifera]|uniref:Mechanosensitive ion channel n=1 Tax=Pilimelia columellifera subsp. columellifera TaxID=706583 RepID=A0ABP6B0N3_9ACTN
MSPEREPACLKNPVCAQVYEWTGEALAAETVHWVVSKPLYVMLLLILGGITRWLVHRSITRLIARTAEGRRPAVLRPLRERTPRTPEEEALQPERRRQRAEAVGTALRSVATVVIYVTVLLWSLKIFGLDLAPLLTSAGIIGVALGFGAQTLVRDLIAGVCILLEDQYGVGDTVDVGPATGVVEAIAWRVTTVRDAQGVLWHIRNGEITRVGNKSQGWAMAVVDIPIGYASVDTATRVLTEAADRLAKDPEFIEDFIEPPQIVGVEAVTVDGAVMRATAKTTVDAHPRVVRELRRRLVDTLDSAGLSGPSGRREGRTSTSETGQGGAT